MNTPLMTAIATTLLVSLTCAASAQAQTAVDSTRATEPTGTLCFLSSCDLMSDAVSIALSRMGVEATSIQFDLDREGRLVALVLTPDSAEKLSSSRGATPDSERLTSSTRLLRLPMTFPEGLTLVSLETGDSFLYVDGPDEGPQGYIELVDQNGRAVWVSQGCTDCHPEQECWWVEDELICWSTGPHSGGA